MKGRCSSAIKTACLLLGMVFVCGPRTFPDEIPGLEEIYHTPIPTQIRMNFDRTIQTHATCSECDLGVVDGEEFLNVYSKKFLVLDLSSSPYGGFLAVITVEGEAHAFMLWLYDISNEEYDLRTIEKISKPIEEELIRELRNPRYQQFWL